jgi:uncharacterized protein (UPF0332 family)
MDLERREILYLDRAKSELDLARAIFKLSMDEKLKLEFELKKDASFFSNVIINSYYCIFYSAKALLITKGIKTEPPEEHKKTLDEFKRLVLSGEIDEDLLIIYNSIVIKADELLGIFKKEKSKRGKFTYKKLPQANLTPSRESLDNAEKFFKNINLIIRGMLNEN